MTSLGSRIALVSVSSVLNRNSAQFGKKFLFDQSEETCWNSDQAAKQFIGVTFDGEVEVSGVSLKFQGGFAGREEATWLVLTGSEGEAVTLALHPKDGNQLQVFPVQPPVRCRKLRVVFHGSTDFYGRIVVYHMDIHGTPTDV